MTEYKIHRLLGIEHMTTQVSGTVYLGRLLDE